MYVRSILLYRQDSRVLPSGYWNPLLLTKENECNGKWKHTKRKKSIHVALGVYCLHRQIKREKNYKLYTAFLLIIITEYQRGLKPYCYTGLLTSCWLHLKIQDGSSCHTDKEKIMMTMLSSSTIEWALLQLLAVQKGNVIRKVMLLSICSYEKIDNST